MKLDSLKALYVHELDELHNGQGLLLKALPRLAQAAFSEELRLTFERYFGLAQDHSRRLDRIFSLLREWPIQTTCKTMKAILDEPDQTVGAQHDPLCRDMSLISAARRVTHHKMAGYESAHIYAATLGEDHSVNLLQKTLGEERSMNESLRELAERLVSAAADALEDVSDDGRATAVA